MEPEDADMMDQGDDRIDDALLLVQQMFSEGMLTEAQRDGLKEMIFDEDTILLSFFNRYQLPDEEQELKNDVLKYIGGGVTQKVPVEE